MLGGRVNFSERIFAWLKFVVHVFISSALWFRVYGNLFFREAICEDEIQAD